MKFSQTAIMLLILGGLPLSVISQTVEWNLDFEVWDLSDTTPDLWHDTTVIENRVGLFPPKWHFNPDRIPEGTGLGRTTDATAGDYAVTLSGFYSYQVMKIISGARADRPGWPIDFRPNRLIGDYKALLFGSCDSLRTHVEVYLTTYHHSDQTRDTIGQAQIILKEATSYEQFELEIDYSDQFTLPDTVIIVLSKERFGFDSPPACLECSHVFFDHLRFTSTVPADQLPGPGKWITIFPNPTSRQLFIQSEKQQLLHITLIGSSGQIVKRHRAAGKLIQFDLNGYAKGLYILKIEAPESGEVIYKKVVLE